MSVSTSGTDPDARLGQLVSEELATLQIFVGVLRQEQQFLVAGDIDGLTPLVTEKTNLSSRLAQLAEQRNQILAAAELPSDRVGMETWLAQQTSAAKTSWSKNWENLLSLAAEARTLNQANGTLISTRLQHNQQALTVLLTASNQAALYGPDGQTKAGVSGRLFGAA